MGHPDLFPVYNLVRDGEIPRWLNLLQDNGLIMARREQYYDIDKLPDQMNVVPLFKPTPAGEFLLKLRGEPEDIRKERNWH